MMPAIHNYEYDVVHKYGRNPNGSLGTEAAITADGALFFASAATTVRIKAGGNVNDTANGSGAREVTVIGVDADGLEIREAIATNGASASAATTLAFFRIYRAYVSKSGTYLTSGVGTQGTNQADIVIEDSGGSNDWITITQYEGQSQHGAFYIPAGKMGYLVAATTTISGAKEADVLMYIRTDARNTSAPVSARRLQLYLDGVVGESLYSPKNPQLLGTDCDVWFTFIPTANGTEASVDFEIVMT